MSVPATAYASPARGASGCSISVIGWPSASSPVIWLGWTMTVAIPSASRRSRNSSRMSRPGTIIEPYRACRLGVERHRAVPQRPAVGVADEDLGRRPEVVLVERVALDLERVIDPDRLVGDLLAIAIDRELGREVAGLAGLEEPRRLEAEVLDDEDAG